MSYKCEVSNNPFSTSPTWSFLIFSLILILGALISFITGASFGIKVDCVLVFSHRVFHFNRQRIYPQKVFHRVWALQWSFFLVFPWINSILEEMDQDLIIYIYLLLLIVLVLLLIPPLLVALFEIDDTLNNRNSTGWKWEETSCFSYISCWFSYYLYSWDPTISLQ